MVSCMMRQSDEKHILGTASTEILLWSSRRDLIAVSNSSGENVSSFFSYYIPNNFVCF